MAVQHITKSNVLRKQYKENTKELQQVFSCCKFCLKFKSNLPRVVGTQYSVHNESVWCGICGRRQLGIHKKPSLIRLLWSNFSGHKDQDKCFFLMSPGQHVHVTPNGVLLHPIIIKLSSSEAKGAMLCGNERLTGQC